YGLPARGAASAALSTEGFGSFVSSTTAPIATGWSNSYRAGITPAEDRHLRTAHKGTQLVSRRVTLPGNAPSWVGRAAVACDPGPTGPSFFSAIAPNQTECHVAPSDAA